MGGKMAGRAVALAAVALMIMSAARAEAASQLEVSGVGIDDSVGGNGDGKLAAEESALLTITLSNNGSTTATDVRGLFITNGNISYEGDAQPYGDIAPGARADGRPFSITTSSCSTRAFSNLQVTASGETYEIPFAVPMICPKLEATSTEIKDAETGNTLEGLALDRPVNVTVTLRNSGGAGISDASAYLEAPGVEWGSDQVSIGDIPAGGEAALAFSVTMKWCSSPLRVQLSISGRFAHEFLDVDIPAACPALFFDPKGIEFDDSETGDGDGLAERGERVRLFFDLVNLGAGQATAVRGTLTDSRTIGRPASAAFPDTAAGARSRNTEPFEVTIAEDAPMMAPTGGGCVYWITMQASHAGREMKRIVMEKPFPMLNALLRLEGTEGTQVIRVAGAAVCGSGSGGAVKPGGGRPSVKPVVARDTIPATGGMAAPLAGVGAGLAGLGMLLIQFSRPPRASRSKP